MVYVKLKSNRRFRDCYEDTREVLGKVNSSFALELIALYANDFDLLAVQRFSADSL